MKTSLVASIMKAPLPKPSLRGMSEWLRARHQLTTSLTAIVICGLLATSIYGLFTGDMYLCLEALFIAFIPYILWSSYRRAGCLDIFAPDLGFPLTYVIYLTIGSIVLPIRTQFGLTLPWIIWLYYIVGLVAYLVGVRLVRAPTHAIAQAGVQKRFWPSQQFLTITLTLLAIGVLCRGAIVASSGLEILNARNEVSRVTNSKGLLAVLSLCADPAFECILLFVLVKRPKGLLRNFLVACLVLVGLNAIASTNRTALLSVAIAAVVVFHYARKRLNFSAFVATGLLAGVFASALGTFRDVSQWGDQHVIELERQGFGPRTYWLFNGYEAVRLPTETFLMTIEHFPELEPYTFGKTSLAEFGAFLPGHTLAPSEVIKDRLKLDFVGFGAAATILAPLWADGGVIGIIAGMFLIGLISRFLYQRVLYSPNYVWILIYGWYMQNMFKAIKDDYIPDLSLLFVLAIFPCVNLLASTSFTRWHRQPAMKQTV